MSDQEFVMHYVCTRDEARSLVNQYSRFWVCNCGCREGRGGCQRSRMDVCLMFTDEFPPSGSGLYEITPADVEAIFWEAADKHLVTRPFRNETDRTRMDGICFCCDDCCGYFLNPAERCDKGSHIERTKLDACTDCGLCAEVCYFGARKLDDGRLAVDRDACYGCGLCADVCSEECIQLILRS